MKVISILKWKTFVAGIGMCLLFAACHKSDPVEPADRTVLIYMAADNSLDDQGFAKENIQLVLEGMKQTSGKVVIYYDPHHGKPVLMAVGKRGNESVLDTLETYEEEDSASPEVLNRVANRVRDLYPAGTYGLILWSHGLGWQPADANFPGTGNLLKRGSLIPTKTFGYDDNRGEGVAGISQMELKDMAAALPGGYRFILFDACLMSSIEVIYELKDKADYIIASPAEVIANGFPYDKIMPLLWGNENELRQLCQEFCNYYANHPNGGDWQSAMIALVNTSGLDALGGCVRRILRGRADEIAVMSATSVWRYTMINVYQNIFFDLGEYIRAVATESQYNEFKGLLDKAVYRLTTKNFYGEPVLQSKYSGLSSYIPLSQWSAANNTYFNLAWPQLVYDK